MKIKQWIQMAVPMATALLIVGCASSSPQTTSNRPGAEGAPAIQQDTDVIAASGGVENSTQADIQLHKEEMVVGKRDVSNGGVVVRTVVKTENVSQPVELQREEYVIERVPASEITDRETVTNQYQTIFQGQEIYIPLARQEPVATKRTVVAEKVEIGKRIETDRQTVTTPVRSEDIQITKVAAPAAGNYWQEAAPVGVAAPHDASSLNLTREEMVVGKTFVDNGGVKLQKIVHTEQASQPVDLRREEYTIDRSPVSNSQVVDADFSQKEIRLGLLREEPVIGTRIQPTDFIRVRKQMHVDTQTVTGTVRSENIEIVKVPAGTPAMGGTSAASQSGTNVVSESGSGKPKLYPVLIKKP